MHKPQSAPWLISTISLSLKAPSLPHHTFRCEGAEAGEGQQ